MLGVASFTTVPKNVLEKINKIVNSTEDPKPKYHNKLVNKIIPKLKMSYWTDISIYDAVTKVELFVAQLLNLSMISEHVVCIFEFLIFDVENVQEEYIKLMFQKLKELKQNKNTESIKIDLFPKFRPITESETPLQAVETLFDKIECKICFLIELSKQINMMKKPECKDLDWTKIPLMLFNVTRALFPHNYNIITVDIDGKNIVQDAFINLVKCINDDFYHPFPNLIIDYKNSYLKKSLAEFYKKWWSHIIRVIKKCTRDIIQRMIEEDLIFNLECVTNVLFFVKLLAKLNPMMFKHFMYEIVTYLNNLNRRSSVIDEFAIRIFTMMSEENNEKQFCKLLKKSEKSFLEEYFPRKLCEQAIIFFKKYNKMRFEYLYKMFIDNVGHIRYRRHKEYSVMPIVKPIFHLLEETLNFMDEDEEEFSKKKDYLTKQKNLTENKFEEQILRSCVSIFIDYNSVELYNTSIVNQGSHEYTIEEVSDMTEIFYVYRNTLYRLIVSKLSKL